MTNPTVPIRIAAAAAAAAVALVASSPLAHAATKTFRDAYSAAMALYDTDHFTEALAAFETARAIAPEPEALYGIARCLHRLGRDDAAIEAYDAFLASGPAHKGAPSARGNLVELLRARASALAGAADGPGARAALERALALHEIDHAGPTDATGGAILAALGVAHEAAGARDAAMKTYGRALGTALDPAARAEVETKLARLVLPPVLPPESERVVVPVRPAWEPFGPGLPPSRAPGPLARVSPWVWVGAGGGLVAGVAAVFLVAALRRPHVEGGWIPVDAR